MSTAHGAAAPVPTAPEGDPSPVGEVDALLLLSFGGPERPEDVMPFLRNVTRGRGIPDERLATVAEHYHHLGGRSPLNELNTEIVEHLRAGLADGGRDLPVYFGNRNWSPFAEDTLARMASDGVRRVAVFATSAWGGYSGCAQYQEDIARAREAVAARGLEAPTVFRLRQFHDHPLFVERVARDLTAALGAARSRSDGAEPRVVFTAHSIPLSADAMAGPPEAGGHLYSRQVAEAARLVAAAAGIGDVDLVWQSRSGPPSVPWLEPDVVDHVRELAVSHGVRDVVVCPIGFLSDHVEVVWDLDHELTDEVAELGVRVTRVATPGPTPELTALVLDLLSELETGRGARRLGEVTSLGCTRDGARCADGCCAPRPGTPSTGSARDAGDQPRSARESAASAS